MMTTRAWILVSVAALGTTGALLTPFALRVLEPEPDAATAYSQMSPANKLDAAYARWRAAHEVNDGDHNVVLRLGWSKGLSRVFTRARGRATLDLINGSVTVDVVDIGDSEVADVWLVDNQPGPGRSVLPEAGDHLQHIGTLDRDGDRGTLHADVGSLFETFEVDVVVVTRPAEPPTELGILFGVPSLFQRVYTRARTGRLPESEPETTSLLSLLGPGIAHASHSRAPVASFDPLIVRGAGLFFNGTFGGNGRRCGTCHPAANNLTIDPEFIATLPSNDPLFVAEFVPALFENFEKPELMRKAGLILENVDGFGDLANRFAMRGVPHTLALSTSLQPAQNMADGSTVPPGQRTGWSGDGAPGGGTLREFAIGAVTQHFPRTLARRPGYDFRLPSDHELDALEAFQLFLGRDEDLDLRSMQFRGEVPARGLEIFLAGDTEEGTVAAGKCNTCHANAGATVSFIPGVNFNFDTGVEKLLDQPADLIDPDNNPPDGGFGRDPHPETPGAFGDGKFNTPPLVEAADTGPFFHNNSVETLEQAVAFYNSDAFNASPAGLFLIDGDSGGIGISLEPTQVVAVAALLRVINALENIRSAVEKSVFAKRFYYSSSALSIIDLAIEETDDAIEVLDCAGLQPHAQKHLRTARAYLGYAYSSYYKWTQNRYLRRAVSNLGAARRDMIVE